MASAMGLVRSRHRALKGRSKRAREDGRRGSCAGFSSVPSGRVSLSGCWSHGWSHGLGCQSLSGTKRRMWELGLAGRTESFRSYGRGEGGCWGL